MVLKSLISSYYNLSMSGGQLQLNSTKLNCDCKFIKEPGVDSVTCIKLANLPRFSEAVKKHDVTVMTGLLGEWLVFFP